MRIVLLCFLLSFQFQKTISQVYYKCKIDNIPIRVEPKENADTFFVATSYYDCSVGKVYINKGFIFKKKNVSENGFIKIYNPYNTLCWDEGWIPNNIYLPTKKCIECHGKGTTGKVCSVCDGKGDWNCCRFKGKENCLQCGGIGYL